MPYVNVRITRGASRDQKARLVAAITTTLCDVLGKQPEHTHVVIDEIDLDNWGFAGRLTDAALAGPGGQNVPKVTSTAAGSERRRS